MILVAIICAFWICGIVFATSIVTRDTTFRSTRFIIQLERYKIGTGDFTISLCTIKNRKQFELSCEYDQWHEYFADAVLNILQQIEHIQKLAEAIVSLTTLRDLNKFEETIFPLSELKKTIQCNVDSLVTNVEHFNILLAQSKTMTPHDLNDIFEELNEANQPILNHLMELKNEIIDNIE